METTNNLPMAAKVFGILHCVIGGFGLVLGAVSLAVLGIALQVYQTENMSVVSTAWLFISTFIAPLFALALIIVGVGLLLKKTWGLRGAIILGIILMVYESLVLVMMILAAVERMGGVDSSPVFTIIGAVFGWLIKSVYHGLTIFLLNRDNIKTFYARYA